MSILTTIALTHLLALASPGPDLILVIRNAISKSRLDGYFTAIGFALGVLCHLLVGLLGLSFLFVEFPSILIAFKVLGAAYLAYIGYQSWSSGNFRIDQNQIKTKSEPWVSLKEGFITNILNVKAMLFFLSLLVSVLKPEIELSIKISAVTLMVTLTFLWFFLVTRFLTIDSVQKRFLGAQRPLERILALLLWGIAIKLSGAVDWIIESLA